MKYGDKRFNFGLLAVPIFIGVMILINSITAKIAGNPDQPTLRIIQFTDCTEQLTPKITRTIDEHNQNNPNFQIQYEEIGGEQDLDAIIQNAKNQVLNNQLDAYFIIDEDIFDGPGQIRVYSQGSLIVDKHSIDLTIGYLLRAVIQHRSELNEISWDFFNQIDNYIPYTIYDPADAESEKNVCETDN